GVWYDPETGSFVSADPLGFPDSMNQYAWGVGNYWKADPLGLIVLAPDNPGWLPGVDHEGNSERVDLVSPGENLVRCLGGGCESESIFDAIFEGERAAAWLERQEREDRLLGELDTLRNLATLGRGRAGATPPQARGLRVKKAPGAPRGPARAPQRPRANPPSAEDPVQSPVLRWVRVVTPWQRRVYQRADIDWDLVRPPKAPMAGKTNLEAAERGYTPVRLSAAKPGYDDIILHHVNQDARGAVVELWRPTHGKVPHKLESESWRTDNPAWKDAFIKEQHAYWRWRTGAYSPAPTKNLSLPGDPDHGK
ncbi:MAG: hypothetical protein JNK60_06270, partial [Acidobacteria bacterium]|nr:hypothetical protein [Acidobacteriota bacterium]